VLLGVAVVAERAKVRRMVAAAVGERGDVIDFLGGRAAFRAAIAARVQDLGAELPPRSR